MYQSGTVFPVVLPRLAQRAERGESLALLPRRPGCIVGFSDTYHGVLSQPQAWVLLEATVSSGQC